MPGKQKGLGGRWEGGGGERREGVRPAWAEHVNTCDVVTDSSSLISVRLTRRRDRKMRERLLRQPVGHVEKWHPRSKWRDEEMR